MLDNPNLLSYDTHEEILLRSFLIGYAKMDTDERLRLLNDYIPLVSNWALCDCAVGTLSFKPGDSEKVWDFAARLLRSHEEYRVRFGAVLTCFCLKRAIPLDTLLGELSRADTSEFYAMMGVAWAYAELFKLDNDRVLGFLSERHADLRTTRKALSKICDSLTTTEEYRTRIKEIRKTLK